MPHVTGPAPHAPAAIEPSNTRRPRVLALPGRMPQEEGHDR